MSYLDEARSRIEYVKRKTPPPVRSAEVRNMAADAARLHSYVVALMKRVEHSDECDIHELGIDENGIPGSCTCGLDALLDAIRNGRELEDKSNG